MTKEWVTTKDLKDTTGYSDAGIKKVVETNEDAIEKKKEKTKWYFKVSSLKDIQPFSDYFEAIQERAEELPSKKGKVDGNGDNKGNKGIEVLEIEKEDEEEEDEEESEVPSAVRVSRKIALDPDVLLYYSLMKEAGGNVTLSQFVNDCVRSYMESLGYEVIISTPEVE